jgi:bacterioferritin-associated ferredoxin
MGQTDSSFEKKPDFIDSQFEYEKNFKLNLYLQLLNPQTIAGLYFQASDDFLHRDFLHSLGEKMAMAKVDQMETLIKLTSKDYDFKGETFPIVLIGLQQIVDDVSGRNSQQDIEWDSSQKLVCRCFGISEKEIVEKVSSAEKPSLKFVTDETMAGGGCGSCHKDISLLINQFSASGDDLLSSKGMTEIDFIKKLHQLMSEEHIPFEVEKVVGTHVWVKTSSLNPYPDVEKAKNLAQKKLGLPLALHLLQ